MLAPSAATAQDGQESSEEEPPNKIAILAGFTSTDEYSTGFLGAEYSRALSEKWSIAGAVEATPNAIHRNFVGLGGLYRKLGKFALFGGIGFETSPGEDGTEANPMLRVGTEYGFPIGQGFEIAPMLLVDFVDEEFKLVWGAGFAQEF